MQVISLSERRVLKAYEQYYRSGKVNLNRDTITHEQHKRNKIKIVH